MTYGLSGVISQVVSILLLPIYTRKIDPEGYGALAMLTLFSTFFQIFAQMGMSHTVFRFYYNKALNHKQVSGNALIFITISTLILTLLCVLFTPALVSLLLAKSIPHARGIFFLSLLIAATSPFTQIFTNILKLKRQVKIVSAISVGQLLVTVGITIFLVIQLDMGVVGVLLGQLIGQVLALIVTMSYTYSEVSVELNRPLMQEMIRYGTPMVPNFIMGSLTTMLGQYVVKTKYSLAETGLYSVGSKLTMPISLVLQSLKKSFQVISFQVHAEDNNSESFLQASFAFYMLIFIYVWFLISIWASEILKIMTAPAFYAALPYVAPLAFISLTEAIYVFIGQGVAVGKQTWPFAIASMSGLGVLLIAIWAFLPIWGALGVVYATILGRIVMVVVIYPFATRVIKVNYNFLLFFSQLGLGILVVYLSKYVPDLLWLGIAIKLAGCALYAVATIALFTLFPIERQWLLVGVNKLRSRLKKTG